MANARLVFVSSDLRDSNLYPDGNSYTLHMTLPIKNISKVDLVSAHFPNSMYNVTKSSNVIVINELQTFSCTQEGTIRRHSHGLSLRPVSIRHTSRLKDIF